MAVTVTAVFLTLIGLALFGFGSQLVMLGGSFYYVLSGLAFLLTAVLLFKRNRAALHVYAVFIVATLAWAIWEVGFDWWQLGPRGGVIILIGLWLLVPWVRKPLGFASPTGHSYGPNAWPLAFSVLASIAVAGYSMAQDPHDTAGSLPQETASATPVYGGDVPDGDWHQYGRTPYGQRYSPLTQVNVDNVSQLKEAWRYQTGDVKLPDDVGETTYQVTPLKIGNTLYICTPHNWAIAIDAATGKEKWKYDPNVGLNPDRQHQTCRGVSYYAEPNAAEGTACAQRVYLPTSDARLIALDAATGQVCTSFADQGVLHLEQGMKYNPAGYYYSTSPPVIAAGKIIIGGAVNDNYSTQEQSGVIRAFDVNSGALVWNWDSGNPAKTEPIAAGETYTTNSPNSWSVFSYDEGLGLVYVPLGNQVPDQLGMGRSENVEKYSSSIVALDINTGKDRWVRQTVHHDLWDMDVPAQPVLLDITKDGQSVPALVGPTKQGDIYVLDRRTGEPLLPITEEPAPGGAIPEDFTSPTQPTTALSFKPEPLQEKDMWGVSMGAPYGVFMGPFLGPLQIPCQAPPWGYVAGADLRTGDIAYKHKNGTVHDMTPLPLPFKLGVPGIGGPMITKGGVAFLGAAVDNYLRAYDLTTGKQLWEARLPAGGQATPMTYSLENGKQYVVMVAGGHGSVGTKPGDYVIAYTLP
ncbi:PQQ-binding-like beta-propeller repeat protein [Agrobacterium salinitolerans]|uniref:outer membrane protein assembly factor BamB family protein n=1 Tax=Agrobacterium salinitolerans TaxID=1183413 RepID=UPI001C23E413|nr:PQQ-binding-like beta-propeller repeat protein [Agrobacterium salinitolerans]QXC47713.1 PQQ-binding-like beta-propeller repeat protein [Agrobacterium salinitolerans]